MTASLLSVLALMTGVLLGATALGAAVAAWCPGRVRTLSTAPTLGVAASVLWLSTVGLIVPPGSWAAVGSLCAAAVTLIVITLAAKRGELQKMRREWAGSAASALVGFVCTLPFLSVMAAAQSSALVHLSENHDGFLFTAIPEWLRGHTLLGSPAMAIDGTPTGTPLIGSTWDIIQNGSWRVGSDSFMAAVSRIAGADPLNLWLPITLVYLVLVTTAAHALCVGLGVRGWRALVIAGSATASAAVLQAVVDQHTPTLLAFAALLILVSELVRGPVSKPSGAAPLLVAICGATIGAVYTELFALVALPLLALVIWPWWRQRSIDGRWIAAVLGWSVLLASPSWVRALSGSAGGNSPEGFHSAYDAGNGWFDVLYGLARGGTQTMHTWLDTSWSTRLVVLTFAVILVTGLAAMCLRGPARAFWSVLVANFLVGWWVLGFSDYSGYPQQRFVEWAIPFLILGSLLGWSLVIAPELVRSRGMAVKRATAWSAAILIVVVALLAIPSGTYARAIRDHPSRRVDRDFTMVADWLGERDPGGSNSIVFASAYFTNLWTPYALRHHPDAAYLSIYADYYDVDHFGTISDRRWLVLDRAAIDRAQIPDGALVESNRRFGLVDLNVGLVTLTVLPQFRGRWSAEGHEVTVYLEAGVAECRAQGRPLRCL